MAKVIMVQGTMSNSGKSFITAGLCRVFMQDGFRTAPFKSQNMALNSYITKDGLEMGRAQVMQAEAAGIEPCVDMNPILLKPTSHVGSQVIVNGEVYGNMKAMEYYRNKTKFLPVVKEAFQRLDQAYDIIVIEGAGSPAEINLKENDIVNMGLAKMVDAPVLLVGDIDRGGVFASLYGTVKLLEKEEQERIKGLVINKFRGDVKILEPGLRMIEEKLNLPVVGVVPMKKIDIDDEDSLSERISCTKKEIEKFEQVVDIVIIRLPHISNFTDFNVFERIKGVSVRYAEQVEQIGEPDLIFIPGTKNTMADMRWLRETGMETMIQKKSSENVPIIGICGGFQMLGKELKDPYGVEEGGQMRGIGLLDMETIFEKEKKRTRIRGKFVVKPELFEHFKEDFVEGYEIHMGKTMPVSGENHISCIELEDGRIDAVLSKNGLVFGSYLHGIFDTNGLSYALAEKIAQNKNLDLENNQVEIEAYKEIQYNKLADLIRESFDMDEIYRILENGGQTFDYQTRRN